MSASGSSTADADPSLAFTIAARQTVSYADIVTSMGTSGLGSLDTTNFRMNIGVRTLEGEARLSIAVLNAAGGLVATKTTVYAGRGTEGTAHGVEREAP